ncbi:MAG: ImmA/IrrE family metallo-endopeptidase [Clostridia bacterium]|nr:ImmA/IrrE family metallo-endopeptidase [Clostridia bacterium]MBR2389040.1 ImmA/IrrE family metallo-endopeptidase [Clostridia bacterium]
MSLVRDTKEISEMVRLCRDINGEGTIDLIKIVKALDIHLIDTTQHNYLKSQEYGKIVYDATEGKAIIIFDEKQPLYLQRFTVAHEVGHYLLRFWEPTSLGKEIIRALDELIGITIEREASMFAKMLLQEPEPDLSEGKKL